MLLLLDWLLRVVVRVGVLGLGVVLLLRLHRLGVQVLGVLLRLLGVKQLVVLLRGGGGGHALLRGKCGVVVLGAGGGVIW